MARETKFKFVDYDGGLKSHPIPAPSGTLVLAPSGKWELHYAGSGFGKRDRWIHGPLARFPLEAHETSASSCRVTISDLRDPTVSASFGLPDTPAAALREAAAERLRESGFILALPIANYDGGLPVHPVPEPAGMLTLWSSLWKLAYGDDKVIKGGIPRFAFVVEEQGPSSCHVQMYDTTDPTIRCGFDVPATSADELRQALVDAGQQTSPAQAPPVSPGQLATGQDSPWWQGVEPHTILARCHYAGAKNAKEMGALKVTPAGIKYDGGTKINCPWSGIANVEIIESRTHRGRQRSAVGIGPIGLAVVGASMLQNKRAAQVVVRRVVRITTKQGKKGDFVPADSSAQQMAPAQAIVARLRAAQAAVAQIAPAPFVADELKKLADLKAAGLLTNEEFARQKLSLLGS